MTRRWQDEPWKRALLWVGVAAVVVWLAVLAWLIWDVASL